MYEIHGKEAENVNEKIWQVAALFASSSLFFSAENSDIFLVCFSFVFFMHKENTTKIPNTPRNRLEMLSQASIQTHEINRI